MKVGNISQTDWRRSLKNQLDTKVEGMVNSPLYTDIVKAVDLGNGRLYVTAIGKSFGKSSKSGLYAAISAVTEILVRKGEVKTIDLDLTLPVFTSEAQVKALVKEVKKYAEKNEIALTGIKAEVNPSVKRMLCTVTATGFADKDKWVSSSKASAEEDIVLVGAVALEGMARILDEKEEELSAHFNKVFTRQCSEKAELLKDASYVKALKDIDITSVMQLTGGGIMAALWNITEGSGCGLEADMEKMTIFQESVEVLEYYNLNPYEMTSQGSFLIITKNGDEAVRAVEEAGFTASKIGVTVNGNQKMIAGRDEQRYLDRPSPDELMNWWEKELS